MTTDLSSLADRVADEQAFPGAFCVGPNDDLYPPTPGMSLRDWFAGQALPAIVATCVNDTGARNPNPERYFARKAYMLADAMLAARTHQDKSNG